MRIKQFIFGNKSETSGRKKEPLSNPFVKGAEGRKEWNDRYMNMAKSIRNWQLAFFSSIAVTVILAFVIAKIATESRVQPFVVETNHGMPYAIRSMETLSPKDQLLVNYAVNQFVINARTVLNDAAAEKTLLDKVYAYSANNTIGFLHDYYEKNNPFQTASQYTVSVDNINSMPLSQNTWQVTWDETKRSATSGSVVSVTHWMADLTYKFGEVNPRFINENPFGIYITQVSWSQSQMQ